jgi:hypothetical protein
MTSADDSAEAVMRGSADNLQPPPVAEAVARAEHTRDAPHPASTAQPRSRGRLVLVAVSVAAAIAVVAFAAGRLSDRGAATTTAAARPTVGAAAAGLAPACPPAVPVLEGSPLAAKGTTSKPLAVQAGQQLALKARIPAPDSNHRLLSFAIYLFPPGVDTHDPAKAVSHSPVQELTPDQQSISPVLPVPTGLAAGTYNAVGYATWPGPSICGVPNPADSTVVGTEWEDLGSIVIN